MKMIKYSIIITALFILPGCSSDTNNPTSQSSDKANIITKINNTKAVSTIYEGPSTENLWAFNITIPTLIVDKADTVVKVKVLDVSQEAFFDISEGENGEKFQPYTSATVEVIDTLKGTELFGNATIHQPGGFTTIKHAIDNTSSDRLEKYGWTALSEEEQETMYLDYRAEEFFDLIVGNEYVIALYTNVNGDYILGTGGYDLFVQTVDSQTGFLTNSFKNVITNNEITLEEIIN